VVSVDDLEVEINAAALLTDQRFGARSLVSHVHLAGEYTGPLAMAWPRL
jgi:hypothetical protein